MSSYVFRANGEVTITIRSAADEYEAREELQNRIDDAEDLDIDLPYISEFDLITIY